jgi:hypothetical protein
MNAERQLPGNLTLGYGFVLSLESVDLDKSTEAPQDSPQHTISG